MLNASTTMVQQSQQLSAAEQGTFTQEVCMQLELLMDGLSQQEAALQLSQLGHQDTAVEASAESPTQQDVDQQQVADGDGPSKDQPRAASPVTSQVKASTGDVQNEGQSKESDGNQEAQSALQLQQQSKTVLSRLTATHLPQLQRLILVALGNQCPGLNPKNLLAPLQLNQLILQRAEVDQAALLAAINPLLDWHSSFAQLRCACSHAPLLAGVKENLELSWTLSRRDKSGTLSSLGMMRCDA